MSDPDPAMPLTVIVPTKQEAGNIAGCLESLRWADQVYVVDSHSSDGTIEIAERHGATVVQFDYGGGWPKKKNWALRNLEIRNPWVLIVDADERITPALRDEIAAAIEAPGIEGYYIRWKFMFLGRWMKHSWSHGWMLRLVRTGRGEYEDLGMRDEGGWDNEVHENLVVEGQTARLRNYLLHDSNDTIERWVRKQNEFSTWNAERRLRARDAELRPRDLWSADPLKQRRAWKGLFLHLPFKPVLMFLYLYVFRLGFLDGRAGLYFCALRACHELTTLAKIYEKRAVNVQGREIRAD